MTFFSHVRDIPTEKRQTTQQVTVMYRYYNTSARDPPNTICIEHGLGPCNFHFFSTLHTQGDEYLGYYYINRSGCLAPGVDVFIATFIKFLSCFCTMIKSDTCLVLGLLAVAKILSCVV